MIGTSKATDRAATNVAALSDDARKAMNSTFDAMSDWRNELAASTERNTAKVFDRMSVAAKAVGWPAEFVDQTRKQMQAASRMQMQMIDQVMDVWEQQLKSPGQAFTIPSSGFPMPQFAGFPSFPGFPQMNFGAGFDFGQMQMAPFQFWMQAAEQWQKVWMQAFGQMMDSQSKWIGSQQSQGRPGPASMQRSVTH